MAGVNLGVMVQLVVVAAGLSWIVELFAKNFDLIRFIGAAYLLFLGVQTLWKARRAVAAAAAVRRARLRARPCGRVRQSEDADFPGGVPAAVSVRRRRPAGAALAARRDVLDHHGDRRRDLGAVRRAAARRRVGPRATDRRPRLRLHPDRGRGRAAGGEPAVTGAPFVVTGRCRLQRQYRLPDWSTAWWDSGAPTSAVRGSH